MDVRSRARIQALLKGTGVTLDGGQPWDPQIHDERFFARVLSGGSLGLGESYMDGFWDCRQVDEFIARVLRQNDYSKLQLTLPLVVDIVRGHLLNLQDKRHAFRIGEAHYDIGNDLYRAMLDQRMVYTCGYWKDAQTLDEAQEAKMDLACRKIGLKAGQRILDIGCGWGSFAKFAAERYGAHVVGITVSKEQATLADEMCAGLPVEIRLQDYRNVDGMFDHVVSFGMFEHVGYKNYRTYFKVVKRCLKDGGFFLLHTIGGSVSSTHTDPWIERYVFPNSMLPSATQIASAAEGLFVMEDWHNFGPDYDRTLMAWHDNFERHWDELKGRYNERFHRMWRYYLLVCAGSFRARLSQLWQIVYSKDGVGGGYRSIR